MAVLDALGSDEATDLATIMSLVRNTSSVSFLSISATAALTGTKGILHPVNNLGVGPGNNHSYAQNPMPTNDATFGMGFRFKPVSWPDVRTETEQAVGEVISFFDSGSEQVGLRVLNGGQLQVNAGTNNLGTTTRALPLGRSCHIEIKVTINNSTGAFEIKVNGTVWLTLTGKNTRFGSSNNSASTYVLGVHNSTAGASPGGNTASWYMDDVVFWDTNGSYNNTYLGDQSVKVSLPTGDGATTDYTRGGTDSGANWSQANEVPPDDDVKYLTDATVGHKNRFTYPAITGVTITAVIVKPRARKDDGTARSIRTVAKLGGGGTEADNGVDFPLSTDYAYYSGVHERDPDGAAWTQSSVNAAEFGVKTSV